MWKALLKKQLLEMRASFVPPKKNGKQRSARGMAGAAALGVLLSLCIAAGFLGIGEAFAPILLLAGLDWLYLALTGMIAVCVTVLLNMFFAYSMLFTAKDNAILLPMPIPASKLLLSKILMLYFDGLLFEIITFLPMLAVWWAKSSSPRVGSSILLFLIVSVLILTFSCILGWIVAGVATRVKSKTLTSVIVMLLVLAVNFSSFRMNAILESAAANMDKIDAAFREKLTFFYLMGTGAAGNGRNLALFGGITLLLTAAVLVILSKNYIRLITSEKAGKKAAWSGKKSEQASPRRAIVRKEMKRFATSMAYMTNMGLSLFLMLLIGGWLIYKQGTIADYMKAAREIFPEGLHLVPVLFAAVGCAFISMCPITVASISMEGKNLWILKSLPAEETVILSAKRDAHLLLAGVPTGIYCVCVCIAIRTDAVTGAMMLLVLLTYLYLSSTVGLLLNLKHPNFTWTNEATVVKQGMPLMTVMLGGWLAAIAICVLSWFTRKMFSAPVCLGLVFVILLVGCAFAEKRLRENGVRMFRGL